MRIVKGVSVLPQKVTPSSSNTSRSNMFAATAAKVEDVHVDGMCSSKTSSSNASAAAREVETSAAATHVKGVRDAENLCAMASARTWCDESSPLQLGTCSGKVRVEKCSHDVVLLIFRASPSKHSPHTVLTTVFVSAKVPRHSNSPSVSEERLQGQTKKQINSHSQDLEHSLRILRTDVHRDLLEELLDEGDEIVCTLLWIRCGQHVRGKRAELFEICVRRKVETVIQSEVPSCLCKGIRRF